MKVVVVGASGNAGTAILRALRDAPEVTEVVALARRVPRTTPPPPYDVASWVSVDVGAPSHADTVRIMADAMNGADAVVHLAWAIQPNHDRDRLRRTNVLGAERMLDAVRQAGVDHVVVASSVGAYSPAHDDERHDESWPTKGIPESSYSVDKADVETMLDRHERDHPDVLITRLRPALIFQRDAGAEIMRYFVGSLVPPALLRGRLPVLTWPAGMRLQAVHADDVARAYLAVLRLRPGGAINIAADDVLRGQEVADVLSGGRWQEVPMGAVHAAVTAGWHSRAIAVSPGWLDMAAGVPLMTTAHARTVLDWSAHTSAAFALSEVVAGMADGTGTASPPLRPRDDDPATPQEVWPG